MLFFFFENKQFMKKANKLGLELELEKKISRCKKKTKTHQNNLQTVYTLNIKTSCKK